MTKQFKVGDEVFLRGKISELGEVYDQQTALLSTNTGLILVSEKDLVPMPQKVIIPQFVADYIEERKKDNWWLFSAGSDRENWQIRDWLVICDMDTRIKRQELYGRAWLDGYEVEKEPLYQIPLKGLMTTDGEQQYLTEKDGKYFASRKHTGLKQSFTKEELKNVPKYYKSLAKGVE